MPFFLDSNVTKYNLFTHVTQGMSFRTVFAREHSSHEILKLWQLQSSCLSIIPLRNMSYFMRERGMKNQTPDWLQKGELVEFAFCVGEIIDIAASDEHVMVLVRSPKGIWRNHAPEWLEYKEGTIKPASRERAARDIELYHGYICKMLDDLNELKHAWSEKRAEPDKVLSAAEP
jgi:hypothetical protein